MTKDTTATSKNESEKDSAMLAPDTELQLVIPWVVVEPAYQKITKKVAKRVKLDGFRKGKVPAQLAKQVVNQDQVIELTLEEVVSPAYVALITEQKKQPLGNPEFHPESVKVGQDWKLHVHIAEKPEIILGDWKKIVKKAKENFVKEKAALEKSAAKNKVEKVDKKPVNKDEPTEAEKDRSAQLGMMYGALVTTLRPRISQLLVKQEASSQLRQLGEQLERFNLTFESFLEQRKLTQEQLTNQVAAEALGRLQLAFIIDAIVVELKLQPTAADVTKELASKTAEIQEYYAKNADARSALENRIAQQKTEEVLLAL
ncbi:hypothetical protein KA012_04825 [Candidatus Woesebacteria bacterium]|nr:hypothetical protein [Candidatus Woesebacteria bacterium]